MLRTTPSTETPWPSSNPSWTYGVETDWSTVRREYPGVERLAMFCDVAAMPVLAALSPDWPVSREERSGT